MAPKRRRETFVCSLVILVSAVTRYCATFANLILCAQSELADYISQQIKETKTKKTLQHLQTKVTGLSDLTHDPDRKLVKEGQVYLKNVKKLYQVIAGCYIVAMVTLTLTVALFSSFDP